MKKKIIGGIVASSLLLPFVTFAQNLDISDAGSIVAAIGQITNFASIAFVSIAVLFFMWGGFTWVTAGADDEKKSRAKSHMINALIGIFLIISVWGIINLMLSTIGTTNTINDGAINQDKAVAVPVL